MPGPVRSRRWRPWPGRRRRLGQGVGVGGRPGLLLVPGSRARPGRRARRRASAVVAASSQRADDEVVGGVDRDPHAGPLCRCSGPMLLAGSGVLLYGGAVARGPARAVQLGDAVATKSDGAAVAHVCRVMAFSSGEENRRPAPRSAARPRRARSTNSLTRSYAPSARATVRGRIAAPSAAPRVAERRLTATRRGVRSALVGGVDRAERRRAGAPAARARRRARRATSGSSTTCHSSIWPTLSTLNQAPMPTELMPSLASVAIHCESKLVWTR